MNSSAAMRNIALPLLVAFAMLYLFGIRSGVATLALSIISVAVLYFALSSMLHGAQDAQSARDASEQSFRHAGHNFRVFADHQGEVWLRASDVKRFVAHDQPDTALAKRYPKRFGQVHPRIDAWYIHHEVLRDLLAPSNQEHVKRFLLWVNRDVLGMYRFEQVMSQDATSTSIPKLPVPQSRNFLVGWLVRHWRGEVGLMATIFGGGLLVGAASFAVQLLKAPVDITLHYRWLALVYVTQLGGVSFGMYWWGRGVLYSTQRWMAAQRSLLVALLASILGFGSVFYGLSAMIDTEKQYFLTDFFTILFDADHKPQLDFDASHNRIMLDGELGFGTTKRLRQLLAEHPQASSIELKSYGGRAAEGFGLMALISKHSLATYARAECMSACVSAYVGGWPRHVASSARFGLHRTGYHWQADNKELNSSDQYFASALRAIGVDESFIARGLKPSIKEIYEPSTDEVLAAGLATSQWNL